MITLREKEIFRRDKDLEEATERLMNEQQEKDDLQRRVQALEQAVVVTKFKYFA